MLLCCKYVSHSNPAKYHFRQTFLIFFPVDLMCMRHTLLAPHSHEPEENSGVENFFDTFLSISREKVYPSLLHLHFFLPTFHPFTSCSFSMFGKLTRKRKRFSTFSLSSSWKATSIQFVSGFDANACAQFNNKTR